MTRSDFDIIVIGGSSGSIPVLMDIIDALPEAFGIPIVIVVHRLKNVKSELKTVLSQTRDIKEPDDKEPLKGGYIYLTPQNYHLLVEDNKTFSLDYSELINHSRPAIDVTFMSVADVYKSKTLGILLSGANADGAEGMAHICSQGGCAIAQDPQTAQYGTMPEAAIKKNEAVEIHTPQTIVDTLLSIFRTHTHTI